MLPRLEAPLADPAMPTEAVHRGLRMLALGTWLAVLLVGGSRLVASFGHGPWSDAGLALFAAHHLVVLAGLLWWSRSRTVMTVAGVLLVLGWLALLPQWRQLPMGTMWAPGYLGFSWAIWTTMTGPRRRQELLVWLVFVVLGLMDLALLMWRDWPVPGTVVLTGLWFLVPTAPLLLFGLALRRVARHLEWQIVQSEASAREGEERRAQAADRAEAARLLHDHVLHALHAVAHVGDGGVTPRMASRECRAALGELARPRNAEPVSSVRELLVNDSLVRGMGLVPEGETGLLPTDVAEAMAAATHAALVNVRDHARTSAVQLALRRGGSAARVVVRDEGVGFHPGKVPHTRLGVRRSIRERMEDIGGEASVVSAPGQGTEVTLSWPRVREDGPDPAWSAGARRELARLLGRTAWPGMLATLVAMPILGPSTGGWPVVLVALAALLVGWWGTHSFADEPALPGRAVVFLVVSVACWCLTLWLGPESLGMVSQHQLWPLWACVSLLHLAVLCLSPVGGLAAVAGWLVLVMAGLEVLHPALEWRRFTSMWMIPVGDGLMTIAVLVAFQHLVSRQFSERELTELSRRSAARVRKASSLQEFWSAQVTAEAMPLMKAVAEGDGRVSREQIDQALLLEATLRDELLLGPDQPRILTVLNDLRRRGWHINTPSVTPAERKFLDGMAYWTSKIGDPVCFKQELKVTMSGAQAVLVVLEPSEEQVALWRRTAQEMGAELDHDEHFARLRANLPGEASSSFPL